MRVGPGLFFQPRISEQLRSGELFAITEGDFGHEVPLATNAVGHEFGRDPNRNTLARTGRCDGILNGWTDWISQTIRAGIIPEPSREWLVGENLATSLVDQFLTQYPQAPALLYAHAVSWLQCAHHPMNYRTSMEMRPGRNSPSISPVRVPRSKSETSLLEMCFDEGGSRHGAVEVKTSASIWATPGSEPLAKCGLSLRAAHQLERDHAGVPIGIHYRECLAAGDSLSQEHRGFFEADLAPALELDGYSICAVSTLGHRRTRRFTPKRCNELAVIDAPQIRILRLFEAPGRAGDLFRVYYDELSLRIARRNGRLACICTESRFLWPGDPELARRTVWFQWLCRNA